MSTKNYTHLIRQHRPVARDANPMVHWIRRRITEQISVFLLEIAECFEVIFKLERLLANSLVPILGR
jgi:hypothetical protein